MDGIRTINNMTSRNVLQGKYLLGSSPEPDDVKVSDPNENARTRRREASLYDAVAGRVLSNRSLTTQRDPSPDSCRRTPSSDRYNLGNPTLAPEEVLFRRRHAPERFAESDFYFAHEDLPDEGRDILPDSDLLKAVHAYSSRFYEAMGRRRGAECFVGPRLVDERSMDETALLAFGILLEEAGREVLGKRGDLVFTEGAVDVDGEEEELGTGEAETQVWREESVAFNYEQSIWKRRFPKRRKLDHKLEKGEENRSSGART